VDTELIAATRVFSFSIAEQHTCINLHIKRLDGRMCCVREYLNNLSAFVKGGCCINYTPWLYGGRCEAAR
jgi:hypothetical protein